MKVLKNIWDEFVYGGHLQCLGAVSITYITGFFLNINLQLDSLIISYFLSYPIYIFNRWKEIEIDSITNLERTVHFRKYINKIPLIFYFSIIILLLTLLFFGNLNTLIFGIILLFFGILYTTHFKKITRVIPLFKNMCVALSFTLLIFFAITYHGVSLQEINKNILLFLIIFIFSKAFLMQILLDLKDVEGDKIEKLKTLSVLIGKEKTLSILKLYSPIITFFIVSFFYLLEPSMPISIFVFLFTIPFNLYSFKLIQKKYSGYILGSSEFLLWGLLIFGSKSIL